MGIAEAAIAAREQHDALAHFGHVGDQGFVVVLKHLGAHGHAQHRVGAIGAGAVLAHAMGAGIGLEVLLIAIVDQGIEPVDAFEHDVTAAPAIAAIGSAEFDELFTQEGHGAAPAIAGADKDFGLIEKLHFGLAFQTPRVIWVSICSTSASRARQSRLERPVWVNPSLV